MMKIIIILRQKNPNGINQKGIRKKQKKNEKMSYLKDG
jgi:hypothetical protein